MVINVECEGRLTMKLFIIALCCLSHVRAFCAVSNMTSTAMSSCSGNVETISFCDAYFTSRAFIGQRIKCRGVLEKIKHGPLVLKPVEGEMRYEEHFVHASVLKAIGVHRCKWDDKYCLCNDDEMLWQGLDGKTVIVEGVLSESAPECCIVSEEFMSPDLLDSRVWADDGSPCTNNALLVAKQDAQKSEYASPCREFKLTFYLANGGRYMIHYYSAVLWMAYISPDRLLYFTRPFLLYPRLADKKKIERVWNMLNGLGKTILPSAYDSHHASLKCRPKRYSQIKSVEIRDPADELVKSVKDLFDFVYEQQRQKK